ncbi:hypothetical protein DR864_24255 [Runella rosea]|uniref:DUF6973 domain-containing protein n=1 Tax=Runella rosea TaxID=2259595 RepID=A0A344TPQ6_9BACT|nr:hypothetical protein [Runella rosea]AXE20627.1 hypothetical protein DR864_24255 [Runella rosea]
MSVVFDFATQNSHFFGNIYSKFKQLHNQNITPVLRESGKNKKAPDSYNVSLNNLQYLIIREDGSNDVMTLYPTDNFLQKSNRRKKPYPYEGLIVFEDFNGNLKGGFKYDKGKTVGEIKAPTAKNARVGDYIEVECSTIDIYSCASANGGQTWNCEFSYTKEVCSSAYISTSNGSGGSYGGSYGGGGDSYGDFGGNNSTLDSYLQDSRARAFYNSLPDGEKLFYFKHPYLILGVALNRLTAYELVNQHYGVNGQANQNNGNAYFHAIWSYLNTRTYGIEDAMAIGDVHERFDPSNANPLYSAMDKHNNMLGIQLWVSFINSNYNWWSSDFFGFNTVLQAITNGQGRRVSGDCCLIPTDGSGLQ